MNRRIAKPAKRRKGVRRKDLAQSYAEGSQRHTEKTTSLSETPCYTPHKSVTNLLIFVFAATFILPFKAPAQTPTQLEGYFQAAADSFNVPLPILESLGYIETHWEPIPDIAGRSPMGLRNDSRFNYNLDSAAHLIGQSLKTLENSPYQNIRGAAAFLSHLREELNADSTVVTDSLVSWWPLIAKYSGIPQPDIAMEFAYHTLEYVNSGVDTNGIVIPPHYVDLTIFPDSIRETGFLTPGEAVPPPVWVGSPNHYVGRNGAPIVFVIIHDTEEQFDYAHSLFENANDKASAQYLVRSQDGYTIQCVRDSDAAWAVNCWNPITLNIEHEGFVNVSDSSFYTEAEYESSARLTASLCEKYNIAEDSLHVFGHDVWEDTTLFNRVPFQAYTQYVGSDYNCNTHTDPGPYWDWHHYFELIHSYDTTTSAAVGSSPATGDTGVPAYSSVTISFSKPMDQSATDSAFSVTPYVPGHFSFNPTETQLTFKPTSIFPGLTRFTVTLDSSARSSNERSIRSPYSFSFTTGSVDTSGPEVITASPANGGTSVSKGYVEFILNEPVNLTNIGSNISLVDSTGKKVSLSRVNFEVASNGLTLLAVDAGVGLIPGMKYTATLGTGFIDYFGYPMKAPYSVTFICDTNESTGGSVIEGFESSLGNWQQPDQSPVTSGVDTSVSSFSISYTHYDGFKSGFLNYQFSTEGGNSSKAICAVENSNGYNIDSSGSVGMWVFGDNSGNQLDYIFGLSSPKVVPVDTIDWYGWKFVSMWRSKTDASTSLFKGFAIERLQSALLDSGGIYIDDIQTNGKVTGIDQDAGDVPGSFMLFQNYPNPFNPTTAINYQLAANSQVTLRVYDTLGRLVSTLVDKKEDAGTYSVMFDASRLPSGVYLYKLTAGNYSAVRKMAVVK